ncbi:MAG TPA: hypothetical protein EYQ42_08255 [Thiotrichaceae bacterium]|jgi:hypothetical protein|nr:hypothetical protein [Thiotrichaceae bacterium]HIM08130.1 hypothetical protein [Gammaproteobacteria bacterium]
MKLNMNLNLRAPMHINEKINKRIVVGSMFIIFLILMFTLIHSANAGKRSISLNSPVSFPVDI